MSEGEFKRRLNRKYTDHTTYDIPYDYYRGSHTTKWVEEMLEEAKRGFLKEIEQFNNSTCCPINNESIKIALEVYYENTVGLIYEWFGGKDE